MRAMMFDIVKTRAQTLLRHAKHARELILEISALRRIAESILNLTARKGCNARGREEDLLVQVRRRIAKSPHAPDLRFQYAPHPDSIESPAQENPPSV